MAAGDANPSHERSWTDGSGEVWHRKGARGQRISERRVRALLRRDDVPLIVWQAFEMEQFVDPEAKTVAAEAVYQVAERPEDVVAHEWKTEDGRPLLMLEHFC